MNNLTIDYDAIRINASRARTHAIDAAAAALLVGGLRALLHATEWLELRVARSLRRRGIAA